MKLLRSSLLFAGATALIACGSTPTEPSSQAARTTLRITVTRCDLGGSVVVRADDGTSATLMTPGEATLMLSPGPRSLSYQRGNEVFGGNASVGSGMTDPLGHSVGFLLIFIFRQTHIELWLHRHAARTAAFTWAIRGMKSSRFINGLRDLATNGSHS